eukprot:Hpha_TRINITY_DN17551_c0_g1::TRINITY_DN17551_c0_g1_i1::g.92471::m.92471
MSDKWTGARDHPVCLVYWYAAEAIFVVATQETLIRNPEHNALPSHASVFRIFCGVCLVCFFLVVGPLLFVAEFKYRVRASRKQRRTAMYSAVAIWFLLVDSPFLLLSVLLYGEFGGMKVIPQAVLLALVGISWFGGFCLVWFRMMRIWADCIHSRVKGTGGKTCDDELNAVRRTGFAANTRLQ